MKEIRFNDMVEIIDANGNFVAEISNVIAAEAVASGKFEVIDANSITLRSTEPQYIV